MAKIRALLLIFMAFILISLLIYVSKMIYNSKVANQRPFIEFVNLSRYFNGRHVAFILRYDDVSLVCSNENSYRYIETATTLANEYGIKVVLAVITRWPPKYGVLTPFNSRDEEFIRKASLFNEIASHSRWHTRPPRSIEDVVGSFVDIEYYLFNGNYKLLTYVYPFGAYDNNDLKYMKIFGVPIGMSFKVVGVIRNPWSESAEFWKHLPLTRILSYYKLPHNKSKLKSLIIKDFIKASRIHGLIIYITHPTKLNWPNKSIMVKYLKVIFSVISRFSNVTWFTTPGELYSYIVIAKHTVVKLLSYNSTTTVFKVCTYNLPTEIWKVPITLVFKVNNVNAKNNIMIYVDNRKLFKGDYSNIGVRGNYHEFYRLIDDYVYVSIVIPFNKCTVLTFRVSRH